MNENDLNELLKLIILPILGAVGTWLAGQLRSKPEKQKDAAGAERVSWELWRDQFSWAKTEITDMRKQLDDLETKSARQETKIELLERRLTIVLLAYAELQAYAHSVVRYLKALLAAVALEPNSGMSIFARIAVALPDLDHIPDPLAKKEERIGREGAVD